MAFSQTIAMARDLLADGRAEDVVRMVNPLLSPLDASASNDPGQVVLHALMARIQVAHHSEMEKALDRLAPFHTPGARADLDDAVRAEVALWLGWAHARRDVQPDEEARALSLLDEAQQLFEATHGLHGRCWALIGRAHAYFAIDEYHLMRQVLDAADGLLAHIEDVQATLWVHDLSIPALRFEGRYVEAQQHVDQLMAYADTHDDRRTRGHAWAQQAALHYDRGSAPDAVLDAATTAASLLRRVDGAAGYPLLATYHAHVGALLRTGDLEAAQNRIGEAEDEMQDYRAGRAHLQTLRARCALREDDVDRAESLLERLTEQVHHLPHGLHRSHIALLRGDLLVRRGALTDAITWMQRALRNARETGHRGHQLRALLALADTHVQDGDLDAADRVLSAAEAYDDYAGVLPYTMLWEAVRGTRAEAHGAVEAAHKYFDQAATAARLIGDRTRAEQYRTALPRESADPSPSASVEQRLGATLERASVSVRLVAAAFVDAVASVAPAEWIGLCRITDDAAVPVHEQGSRPDSLPLPRRRAEHAQAGFVRWMRLCDGENGPLFLGLATLHDDGAWDAVRPRITSWMPLLRLALDHARLHAEHRTAHSNADPGPPDIPVDGFIAESSAMRSLARQIERMHASHSPVLVRGERGTGTDLVARAVHVTSERSGGPCEVVRCDSMQHEPLQIRLFGRTNGDASMPGAIQQADGGTLLLQDVDAVPASVQSALIEVLEEGMVLPVGGSDPVPVDVRVVATTNADLKTLVESGDFREALFNHLNVIPLRVPPLRERREDLPLLVRHFLDTLRPSDTSMASVTTRALDAMLQYEWPGNVRQLRNEIERALLYVSSEPAPTIDVGLLSDPLLATERGPHDEASDDSDAIFRSDRSLSDVLARTEADVIRRVLRACDGQVTASADVLGLSRQGLYKKMKRLGVDPSDVESDSATVRP